MLKISALMLTTVLAMPVVAAKEKLPPDVLKFTQLRENCDHFRGELPDPAEKKRLREVLKALNKFCTGTDKKLAALKEKYSSNADILARLSTYEPEIEAKP